MKKTFIIIFFLIVIGICIFLLKESITGGRNTVDPVDGPSDPVAEETDEPENSQDDIDDPDAGEPADPADNNPAVPADPSASDPENITLNLYTIDYDSMECVPNETNVDITFEKNAENIINKVIESFLEKPIIIQIEETPDSVIIYLDNEGVPVKGVSADMETAMLDCMAYSLIDNLGSCKNVYFRTNAGAYSSDNLSLEYDESYLSSEL